MLEATRLCHVSACDLLQEERKSMSDINHSITFYKCEMHRIASCDNWRDETARSLISHSLVSKIIPNLPIWWKCIELKGIMVNKGRIHREIRKFLMYSSKLIKLDDELMIEIGENYKLWKITSNRFHGIKNHWIWTWFRGETEDWSGKKILES